MTKEQLTLKLFQELCLNYSRDLQIFIYSLTRKDQYAMEEIYKNTMVQALRGLKNLKDQDKMKKLAFFHCEGGSRKALREKPAKHTKGMQRYDREGSI